jgi:VCBS repeat-containing protein
MKNPSASKITGGEKNEENGQEIQSMQGTSKQDQTFIYTSNDGTKKIMNFKAVGIDK